MRHFTETIAITAIIGLIFTLMGGAAFAWTVQGAAIWSELRLAEIVGCFGF